MSAPLRLVPVENSANRRAFIDFPKRLHHADPNWIAPLDRDVQALLRPGKHPFHAIGSIHPLLALRGTEVVGRIARIENPAHQRHCGEDAAFFGFFECENDPDVARTLMDAVAASSSGHAILRGPYSPSTNYECGVLIGGDVGRPRLMMPHNPPWYGALLEGCGLRKAMDLIAFQFLPMQLDQTRWQRVSKLIQKREQVTVRPFDMKHFKRELRLIQELYHDAWSANWGFVPMAPCELKHMASELRPILRADLGAFVMKDGHEVGFHLALPDYNEILQHLKGKLWPFGLLRLLLSKKRLKHTRLMILGISKQYQHRGLDAVLYADVAKRSAEVGIESCEASWVLETNNLMCNALERGGGRAYRTYRLYEKPL
ncbi:MAG: N-acetyltransferase [Planctomycetes bacterium]|nr:N-acetyltransferase [Planctomycetota bacterium]